MFNVDTPSYIIDTDLLEKNLKILDGVKKKCGCKILLASKAYANYETFDLIGRYLDGVTSSSLHEARLGYEEMGKEVHIFSPAYRENEIDEIAGYCGHIVFNSFGQWEKYKERVKGKCSCALRINPEYSEIETDIYNPCIIGSRFGIRAENMEKGNIDGIDGLHFHTMCEQNSDVLERTIKVVDEKFGKYIKKMKWINFGGGHHITRDDYDTDTLIRCVEFMQNKYDVQVYLEPGEAVALNAGFLAARVEDIIENGMDIAIIDASAACHMPDVIEMPYRPNIVGAGKAGEKKYTYRLGGPTCLAGDVIGDYSFDEPLKIGNMLIFEDMAIYSMVKNNTFNGVNLPDIYLKSEKEGLKKIKSFGYEDFKMRL